MSPGSDDEDDLDWTSESDGNEDDGDQEEETAEVEDDVPMLFGGELLRADDGSNSHFTLLTLDQVAANQQQIIDEVNGVMCIHPSQVRLLLSQFSWDKEKLMERFYEGDPEEFMLRHNIPPSMRRWMRHSTMGYGVAAAASVCEICYENVPANQMSGIGCQHVFCAVCWTHYLEAKMRLQGQFDSLLCPGHGCPMLVDDETVLRFLVDPKLKLQFQQAVTKSFVECSRLLAWCTGQGCERVAKVSRHEACRISCDCGEVFCFACAQEWHEPVRCHLLRKWILKNEGESMTSSWLAANTKVCPKCKATIEKNGGCNHMTCKNAVCKHEFCWVCMGEWEPHGNAWFKCTRYNEEDSQQERQRVESHRAELSRYLHYYQRYMSHKQSLDLEYQLYDKVREKMEIMQQQGLSWIEVQFLTRAVDVLRRCRRALMFTYVFAYYLQRSNQQEIFEDNQANLQMSTEVLSEYLEREITLDNISDLKQKVQDRCRFCETRAKVLMDHVHEGYELDSWRYRS